MTRRELQPVGCEEREGERPKRDVGSSGAGRRWTGRDGHPWGDGGWRVWVQWEKGVDEAQDSGSSFLIASITSGDVEARHQVRMTRRGGGLSGEVCGAQGGLGGRLLM